MACLTDIRRQIIAGSPHLATAASGNTADSATICHVKTAAPADVKRLVVNFAPFQSGSGTPSPSNVRTISGYNSIDVTRCGVNLLQSYAAVSGSGKGVTYNVTRNASGEVSAISMSGTGTGTNIFRNMNYTVNTNHLLDGKIATNAFSNQANIIPVCNPSLIRTVDGYAMNNMARVGILIFEIDKKSYPDGWFRIQGFPYDSTGVAYNTTVYPFISLYQDRNSAFEPYTGQTITVSLPDTFYGGQLDILTGVLTVDCAVRTITGNDIGGSFYQRGDGNVRFTLSSKQPTADYGDGKATAICASNMSVHPNGTSHSTSLVPSIGIGAGNATPYMVLPASYGVTDLTSAAAWLNNNNFQFAYKMKYPETYQLTPQTIKTLRGINNIWSDQGTVEIKYWTH